MRTKNWKLLSNKELIDRAELVAEADALGMSSAEGKVPEAFNEIRRRFGR